MKDPEYSNTVRSLLAKQSELRTELATEQTPRWRLYITQQLERVDARIESITYEEG